MIVNLRIALSSEAPQNATLCGVLIKMRVSGGDRLTLRTNHKDEEICINRSTIFASCNDVPKIEPCDQALVDRQGGVFEKQVSFLERHPNPIMSDFEKPVDKGLKDLFSQPEYQSAFLSILLDAYQTYKKQGHKIPSSVTAGLHQQMGGQRSCAEGPSEHGIRHRA
jgi:phage/plasmid-associated DNA primase